MAVQIKSAGIMTCSAQQGAMRGGTMGATRATWRGWGAPWPREASRERQKSGGVVACFNDSEVDGGKA